MGFYPDYLDAILDNFQYLSGPDGVTYGKINKTRIYPFGWYKLFDGTAHVTEPYILVRQRNGGIKRFLNNTIK